MIQKIIHVIIPVMCSLNCVPQPAGQILPDPVVPGTQGCLESEFIFSPEHPPTPECHASTITEIPGGRAVAWFGGSREGQPDVEIWFSRNRGGEWSEPVPVADGIQGDSLRYPCWNPVLWQQGEGPLILFYKVGPNPREWWGEKKISTDGGISWSPPANLGHGRLGALIGPVKNKPVMAGDSLLICPSSTERIEDGEVFWKVHFELTRDQGKSWEVIGPINNGTAFDAIQPALLMYRDGSMQALCRTRQEVVAQSWSSDGGRSWSKMSATSLPNPNAGIDGVTLRDGRLLLVYNHSGGGSREPGRGILVAAISQDGHLWKPVMTLENKRGEYSYPAVIQAADGLVHITYTYDRRSIKHVVVDPGAL
jgi:predicted neuraminidase